MMRKISYGMSTVIAAVDKLEEDVLVIVMEVETAQTAS
jgi:hypothetical protein